MLEAQHRGESLPSTHCGNSPTEKASGFDEPPSTARRAVEEARRQGNTTTKSAGGHACAIIGGAGPPRAFRQPAIIAATSSGRALEQVGDVSSSITLIVRHRSTPQMTENRSPTEAHEGEMMSAGRVLLKHETLGMK